MSEPELPPLEKYKPYGNLTADIATELGSALRAHYENGASMEKLGKMIGCATGTIRRRLVDSGGTIRQRGENLKCQQFGC